MNRENKKITGGFDRAFSIIVTILLVLSCGPFFILGGQSTIINVFFFGIFLLMFTVVISKGRGTAIGISRSNYNNLVVSIIFFSLLFFPLRPYDGFVAVSIWGVIFLMFLLLDEKYLNLVARIFSGFIFYVVLFVIIVWLLLFVGVSLPYWEFNTGLIGVSKSTFIVYPGTAILKGQNLDFLGRSVYRMSGIFSEPGHYGIFCFFAYLLSSQLSKFKRTVIVVGSLLSFSMGTFVLWTGYLFVSTGFTFKKKLALSLVVLFIAILGYIYLPQELLDRLVFSKIDSEGTLDNRTDINFIAFFQGEHSFISHLMGYGRLVFEEFNLSNSDYRGFYLRYGIIGIVMYFFWVLMLNKNGGNKNLILLFFVATVIFLHRAWLIDYFILYFILYYISKRGKL